MAVHAIIEAGEVALPEPAETTRATHELTELLAFGTQFVELVSDEDLTQCPACRVVVGRILPAMSAPLPPIAGCVGACACRLAPLSLE